MFGHSLLPFEAFNIVHTPLEEMGDLSPWEHAEKHGGVCIFCTEQQSAQGIGKEAFRFITDGQKTLDKKRDRRHNAVIMWNRRGIKFPNNICPYDQRFHHGFETISLGNCRDLGIKHEVLIDEFISEKDGRMIEKAAHYALDDLPLGVRLHCTPGAGRGDHSSELDGKRRVVGITFLPPGFFESHPNIVLVASAPKGRPPPKWVMDAAWTLVVLLVRTDNCD